ncbi:type II toxin-antitoxin system HipA family toxin [Olsenella sp. YH-ols2217]|uniref:Type II toxin-antitoxin system HipA family toxin n=1 Tax=Kribbibacterium absianum TaxID=3044210 RepID=A0ABT6ZHN3_9ACTN|nr:MULTISPECIES: type II toxin-antitoxin system HipA family toxin [unclassified Olsenella]MDJ1121078.1 type II toxin-antitoxin system HipA family toxin [Olsenella sp. YH-ols2216]MDJ1128569.1 type II toxin-antitoxin system HipA family toxin [Olsenella sp. YH-ols2217]
MVPTLTIWLDGTEAPRRVGLLRSSVRRGELTTTFSYDESFLAWPGAFAISPELSLRTGSWHGSGLPGALSDASPDRWGRLLIKRDAADLGLGGRMLDDVDYLMGVLDVSRQGALRLALPEGPDFLSAGSGIPPMVELTRLADAARQVSAGEASQEAVKELLDAGSGSLGGARPKASVVDSGRLWLAKFPHEADEWDVLAWEAATLECARAAGIGVPASRTVRLGAAHGLLTLRFDRRDGLLDGRRVPYLSGLSLVGGKPGDLYDYADVADRVRATCREPSRALEELFRRVCFSVAANNTDDHLRNLGLLRGAGGWRLSPLFDVNPDPSLATRRVTGVLGETEAMACARALPEFAEYVGVLGERAAAIAQQTGRAVAGLVGQARQLGVPQSEQGRFASALAKTSGAVSEAFE